MFEVACNVWIAACLGYVAWLYGRCACMFDGTEPEDRTLVRLYVAGSLACGGAAVLNLYAAGRRALEVLGG